jgi:FkbM family methyltransferase
MGLIKLFFSRVIVKSRSARLVDNIFNYYYLHFIDYLREKISRKNNTTLLSKVMKEYGIGFYGTAEQTGELFFIDEVLPHVFGDLQAAITVFDVGANEGEFAQMVAQKFDKATIHCFEPNAEIIASLKNNLKGTSFVVNNLGLGDHKHEAAIYTYGDGGNSEHASLFEDVLKVVQKTDNVVSNSCEIDTLDNYVLERQINHIHFLKIDTEGYELNVFNGAKESVARGIIDVIQFEFNEMNVVPRVFLKDFYGILPGYKFYRLAQRYMVPLGEYSAVNEIFAYQNIVAVRAPIASGLQKFEKFNGK